MESRQQKRAAFLQPVQSTFSLLKITFFSFAYIIFLNFSNKIGTSAVTVFQTIPLNVFYIIPCVNIQKNTRTANINVFLSFTFNL